MKGEFDVKKKLVSLLALSCTFAMTLGMTAFATESVSDDEAITEEVLEEMADEVGDDATCDIEGLEVSVDAVEVETYEDAAALVEDAEELVEIATSLSAAEAETAVLVAVVDVTIEGISEEQLAAGVTVTLTIPDFDSSLGYTLLHCVDGTWEEVEGVTFANGKISGVFYSFSPVAIVSYEIEEADDDTDDTTSNSDSDSPSTGDAMPFAVAVAGLGVVAVVASKKRAAL